MITPVGTPTITEDLEKRIRGVVANTSDVFILPQRNACYVAFDGISTQLRDKLNLAGTSKIDPNTSDQNIEPSVIPAIPVVITAVVPGGYNGYASTDIWEWLNLKVGR